MPIVPHIVDLRIVSGIVPEKRDGKDVFQGENIDNSVWNVIPRT